MAKPQEINNACPTQGSWTKAILVVTGDIHWSVDWQVVREGSLIVSKDRELQRASFTPRQENAASSRPCPQLCHSEQLRAVTGGTAVSPWPDQPDVPDTTSHPKVCPPTRSSHRSRDASAGNASVLSATSSNPALSFSLYCSQSQNTNLGHLPWESGYPMVTDLCYTCTCMVKSLYPSVKGHLLTRASLGTASSRLVGDQPQKGKPEQRLK